MDPGSEPVLLKKTVLPAHLDVLGPQNQETVNLLIMCDSAYPKSILCRRLAFGTYL